MYVKVYVHVCIYTQTIYINVCVLLEDIYLLLMQQNLLSDTRELKKSAKICVQHIAYYGLAVL